MMEAWRLSKTGHTAKPLPFTIMFPDEIMAVNKATPPLTKIF